MKDLEVEIECLKKCVDAIEKMKKKYTDGGDESDSVAIGRARKAIVRTVNWLVAYYQK
jgi:hypothetical protein